MLDKVIAALVPVAPDSDIESFDSDGRLGPLFAFRRRQPTSEDSTGVKAPPRSSAPNSDGGLAGPEVQAQPRTDILSRDDARAELRRFRADAIERDFPGAEPNRCILREEIIEALVKGGGDSKAAFVKVVPLVLRERIDPRQMPYLDDIYEIIARISEDEPSAIGGDPLGVGAMAFRPYREARLFGEVPADIGACSPRLLINAIGDVVHQEGPIHVEEIARRLQRRAGGERAGRKAVEAVGKACEIARARGKIRDEGPFWRETGAGPPRPRDRAKVHPVLRNIEMIAPSEIRQAASLVIAADRLSDKAAIVLRVANALGYSRPTEKISRIIGREVLKVLGERAARGSQGGSIDQESGPS